MKSVKNANIFVHAQWVRGAVALLAAEHHRSSDTPLVRLSLPRFEGITLYLKDESVHPTGSLKHRLARSLILYALCNGWVGPETVLIEASSGSTAVSEAYFARLLGLRFIAVMPRSVSGAKIEAIRQQGGAVHFVDSSSAMYAAAEALAQQTGGLYLDQFTYAERATDWRGNNNIAESIFSQMAQEEVKVPDWIVCGAGTGGTAATIGRYVRYARYDTRVCVADPEGSVFHQHYNDRAVRALSTDCGSCIEGIGRARVEPSFLPQLIDRMMPVSDSESIGAMRALSQRLGRSVGGSTGTNIVASFALIAEMASQGRKGAVVTILCDSGQRYADTYYNDAWLTARDISWQRHARHMASMLGGDSDLMQPLPAEAGCLIS